MHTAPDPSPARRRARLPIARRERVVWAELDPARRAPLRESLYAIFSTYYLGLDAAAFEELFLSKDDVVLGLLYGADDRLAGFCSITVSKVDTRRHRYGVLSAGVYIDTRYRGGHVAAGFGIQEALRHKLRNPRLRMGYLGLAHTPAPYRLFARTLPRIYPSRPAHSGEPPAEIAFVMQEVLRARGWPCVDGDPWVIATPMLHREPDWLERKPQMLRDPDVRYFVDRVPGWRHEGHALAVWNSLGLRDIARATLRPSNAP